MGNFGIRGTLPLACLVGDVAGGAAVCDTLPGIIGGGFVVAIWEGELMTGGVRG